MNLDYVDMTSESYTGYFIDEGMDEVIIHFKETDVIMSLIDFNKLIEKRMENIGVIDEEIIHGNIIDLTENSYLKYELWDKYDSMYLLFGEWKIEIDKRDLFRLVKDVEKKQQENTACKIESKPTRETLLNELMKTIDKEYCLIKKYNKKFAKLSAITNNEEIKRSLLPLSDEINDVKEYKEKLEAQLRYGELQ